MKYHVSFDIDFRRNPYEGKYIVFEGIDGSGKTTQVRELKKYFERKGERVDVTKEPSREPPAGTLVRDFIKGKIKIPAAAAQYLFAADREIHQKEFVEPALEKGSVVISDRCFWSSVCYGILDRNETYNTEKDLLLVSQSILSFYHQFIVPDITFLIDVPVATAMSRISKTGRKKDYYEEREKLMKIKEGYDWLSGKFKNEIKVIDGEQPAEKVTNLIIQNLEFPLRSEASEIQN